MMSHNRSRPLNMFIYLFTVLLVFCLHVNLVICNELDDDSLEDALEAIERRQRDLQLRDNYGQPENIGYGFQKNLGFFEPGPARHLGASREPSDWGFVSADAGGEPFLEETPDKRERSNFRERATKQSDGLEYLQALRGLWDRYQRTHSRPADFEDLTDEEVAEMLNALEQEPDSEYKVNVPRMRRNYRIFDGYPETNKRSPSFGQGLGLYGKRSNQRINYATPPSDAFLYSLKWVNPGINREGVEGLRGSEPWGDERDRDVLSVLSPQRYQDDESWLPDAVEPDEMEYSNSMRRGYHQRDRKRAPVKRNAGRAREQTTDEEVKDIFASSKNKPPTPAMSKKPTLDVKKVTLGVKTAVNATKKISTTPKKTPAVSSIQKKVVRRAEPSRPGEISNLFRVQKKSIDWSKHFGVDKRMYVNPFDTRVFNTKRNTADNINEMGERIKNAEDKILEEALKYTGAHSDDGIGGVREKDIQYLNAAYKLEKMSETLENFKKYINDIGTDAPLSSTTAGKESTEMEGDKAKRVAVKKEGVVNPEEIEFLNWQNSASAPTDAECPLLEQLVSNCLRMEEMLGKFAELLTPACTLQQICYTCGPEFGFSRPASCDLMFLSEAQHLCQDKPECLNGASETVLALREVYEQSAPSGTCRANPCVAEHFLTSPSGVVSLSLP